jgi:hypothetical protein
LSFRSYSLQVEPRMLSDSSRLASRGHAQWTDQTCSWQSRLSSLVVLKGDEISSRMCDCQQNRRVCWAKNSAIFNCLVDCVLLLVTSECVRQLQRNKLSSRDVLSLDLLDFRFEKLKAKSYSAGWLSSCTSVVVDPDRRVSGWQKLSRAGRQKMLDTTGELDISCRSVIPQS